MRGSIALTAVVLLSIGGLSCTDEEGGEPLTIMPIGDSITQAARAGFTYRCQLDQLLREAGVEFDFVGSETEPWGGGSYNCAHEFDQDHEAERGAFIMGKLSAVEPIVEEMKPDVALVHLGTFNILRQPGRIAAEQMARFVEGLQAAHPDITILVAQLIPCLDLACTGIPDFNEVVASYGELSTDTSKVVVVDMYTGYSLDDLFDVFHPDDDGSRVMANRWMAALTEANLVEA